MVNPDIVAIVTIAAGLSTVYLAGDKLVGRLREVAPSKEEDEASNSTNSEFADTDARADGHDVDDNEDR